MHHLPEINKITTPRVKNFELPFKSSLTYKFIYLIAIKFLIYDLMRRNIMKKPLKSLFDGRVYKQMIAGNSDELCE